MMMQVNPCLFSWALCQLTKVSGVKCLAPSTWKSITPPILSASYGWITDTIKLKLSFLRVTKSIECIPFILSKGVVSKIGWNNQSIYSFTEQHGLIRHPKEGHFQLASCQPLLSAQRTKLKWWPTLVNVFWVQHDKGEYITFCIGSAL
jgi:hypothetical protein